MSVKNDSAIVVMMMVRPGGRMVTVYLSDLSVFDNLDVAGWRRGRNGEDFLSAFLDNSPCF
jgi:hypothetical protein